MFRWVTRPAGLPCKRYRSGGGGGGCGGGNGVTELMVFVVIGVVVV